MSLKQLINYFPDLEKEYESWVNEKLNYAIIETYLTPGQKVDVKMTGIIDDDLIDLLFPLEHCPNRKVDKNTVKHKTSVCYDAGKWTPNITQKWHGPFDIGDACVVPVIKNDIGLNVLSAMYVVSYVFGMMARYYPSTWVSLRRVEVGDRIYPFALRILEFVQQKFPLQVLDFLNAPPKEAKQES